MRHSLFGTFCIIFISLLHMECVFRSMLHSLSACSSPRDLLGHFASSTKLPHLLLRVGSRSLLPSSLACWLLLVVSSIRGARAVSEPASSGQCIVRSPALGQLRRLSPLPNYSYRQSRPPEAKRLASTSEF